jgi:hypothetical protein
VIPEHVGYFLHWIKICLEGSCNPVVEKLFCRSRVFVFPESLEVFSQKIPLDRGDVQFQKFSKSGGLFLIEVLWSLQKQPAAIEENVLLVLGLE